VRGGLADGGYHDVEEKPPEGAAPASVRRRMGGQKSPRVEEQKV
jgi:hypothetical protein